ncbi:MAG: ATP-binding cassette domain-containing protein, partial [Coriobacteriales bacterium]|nr:ATP-binding cassette domain-containing protein [Coriobacteriales bacterium]
MNLINAKEVTVEYGRGKVLDRLTLGVDSGECIGIVGENGSGKSTLLRILAGEQRPEEGEVVARSGVRIAVLGQSDAFRPEQPALEAALGKVEEYRWRSDAKIRRILAKLLPEGLWRRPVGELSGGQRRAVDLARVLCGTDDVLMLDEPTNHLDLPTITWFAAYLRRRFAIGQNGQGRSGEALLLVTHDRWFLDQVASRMWEVRDGEVEPFEGGFSAYIQQRAERAEAAESAEAKRRNLLRRELAWLSRGARARSSKPKFHLKAARALVAEVPALRDQLKLERAALTRLGKQVYKLSDVSLERGGRPVLRGIDWTIGPGERLAILGANGSGKSSLLGLLLGQLPPSAGQLKVGKTVKAALLSQELSELSGHAQERVRELLKDYPTSLSVDGRQVALTQLLEQIGFKSDGLNQPVAKLSGGQKRRLQLMLTLAREPNVLLLDEPGNDMDIDMIATMEDLLDSWPGTLILVSHDRYLVERSTDQQYALVGGQIHHLPGGVEQYLAWLAEPHPDPGLSSRSDRPATSPEKAAEPELLETDSSKDPMQKVALAGAERQALRKQLASTERKLK